MNSSILEIIPFAISLWTGLTLAWGIYIGCWFDNLLTQQTNQHARQEDYSYIICIWSANILLFVLGFVVPFLIPTIRGSIGDAVLVINVFYSAFLVTCTLGLLRWSASTHSNLPVTDHLPEID